MVDDQVNRYKRVDHFGVSSQTRHCRPHRGQVYQGRHSGKVLHHYASRQEGNAGSAPGRRPGFLGKRRRLPGGNVLHILRRDLASVALTERRLQHDPDGKRQAFDLCQASLFKHVQAVNNILTFPNL